MRPMLAACAVVLAACSSPPRTWPGAPAGFEPVAFPETTDDCDGDALFVLPSSTTVEGTAPERTVFSPRIDDVPEGIEREVASFVRPRAWRGAMQWTYNGPGGRPYLESKLAVYERPLLLFDRRVSRARFDARS